MTDEARMLRASRALRPGSAAAVADDPFWAAFRARHPDVDLVLLPPRDPDTDPGTDPDTDADAAPPGISPEVVREALRPVAATWRSVAPLVTAADHASEPRGPSIRWAVRDGGHALLLRRAVPGIGAEAGADLAVAIGSHLAAHAWTVTDHPRPDRVVVRAAQGLVDVQVEAGAGATVITVASGVMAVSDSDQDALLEEVRSWL